MLCSIQMRCWAALQATNLTTSKCLRGNWSSNNRCLLSRTLPSISPVKRSVRVCANCSALSERGCQIFLKSWRQTLAKSSPEVIAQFPFLICSPIVAQNKQHGFWQSGSWDQCRIKHGAHAPGPRNFTVIIFIQIKYTKHEGSLCTLSGQWKNYEDRLRVSLVVWWLGCQTCNRVVVGSIPGRAAIKLPRSTQPSIPLGWVNRVLAWLRRGAFTCVGWQVTLCDPVWQVTPRSSESYMHL